MTSIVLLDTTVKFVNSNVARGGGLIDLLISYVMMERVFTNNAVNKASELNTQLMGAGRGSFLGDSSDIGQPC